MSYLIFQGSCPKRTHCQRSLLDYRIGALRVRKPHWEGGETGRYLVRLFPFHNIQSAKSSPVLSIDTRGSVKSHTLLCTQDSAQGLLSIEFSFSILFFLFFFFLSHFKRTPPFSLVTQHVLGMTLLVYHSIQSLIWKQEHSGSPTGLSGVNPTLKTSSEILHDLTNPFLILFSFWKRLRGLMFSLLPAVAVWVFNAIVNWNVFYRRPHQSMLLLSFSIFLAFNNLLSHVLLGIKSSRTSFLL